MASVDGATTGGQHGPKLRSRKHGAAVPIDELDAVGDRGADERLQVRQSVVDFGDDPDRLTGIGRPMFQVNQDTQRLSNQFERRSAKEVCSGFVDTADASVHIARVDYVRRMLDDVAIATLDSMTLDESRDFHDQLFVSKRNFDVIVGAGSESLKFGCVLFTESSPCADYF